jgi:magnesium and cobalt transporter
MNDDSRDTSKTGRWIQRLADSLSGEPRDRDDLLEVIEDAHERGIVSDDDCAMLQGVLEVGEQQARDIMVPRSQMVVINRDDLLQDILPAVIESGHSRFPVVADDREKVVGILLAKDLLRLVHEEGVDEEHGQFDIKECLRSAVFVPESKRLNVLLKEFRVNHNHMAIVVDEYGGVAGLVTIEDVLEQIVGDIGDEYDIDDELDIRRDDARHFTVRAQTRIEEFNQYFNTEFSDEEFDTIGGLLLAHLGRLPRRGEIINMHGFEYKVLRGDRRRIELLRLATPQDIAEPEQE